MPFEYHNDHNQGDYDPPDDHNQVDYIQTLKNYYLLYQKTQYSDKQF